MNRKAKERPKKTTRLGGAGKKLAKASEKPEPITRPAKRAVVKAGPARRVAPRKLFEFYRSVDDSITDMKGWYRVSLLDPSYQYATYDTLTRVCETTYGPGNFVALEVRATTEGLPQGLPHSYWVIKVRHGRRRPTFEEVIPPDEMLKHYRQTQSFMPASDEDKQRERQPEPIEEECEGLFKLEGRPYLSAFSLDGDVEKAQRGAEASLVAALGLPKLREPEFKTVKKSKQRPEIARAIKLIRKYEEKGEPIDKDRVIEKLMTEGRENARWKWEGKGNPALQGLAEKAYNAAMVAIRREKKPRATKTVSKKKDGA
jgi:hypothetical protein